MVESKGYVSRESIRWHPSYVRAGGKDGGVDPCRGQKQDRLVLTFWEVSPPFSLPSLLILSPLSRVFPFSWSRGAIIFCFFVFLCVSLLLLFSFIFLLLPFLLIHLLFSLLLLMRHILVLLPLFPFLFLILLHSG